MDEVRVDGITSILGRTPALRSVSCSFHRATVSVLQGRNGAGKTTLLNVVGGLLKPTRGWVAYLQGGRRLCPLEARARMGWIGHDGHGYRDLTGRENVRIMARLQGAPPQAADAVIDRVDAGGFCDRPMGTLSRGQRQRMALARALVQGPSLLLLDEPWSGLDAASGRRLEAIVDEERSRGAIVVCVTHDPAVASRLRGRVLRLERGRLAGSSTGGEHAAPS